MTCKKILWWTVPLLAAACASAAGETPEALKKPRETYFAQIEKLDARFDGRRKEMDARLATSVKALEPRFAEKGNLEGVLAVREVLAAIEDPFEIVVVPARENIDELKTMVGQYETMSKELDDEEAKVREELKTKYIAYLERMKTQLTMAQKIDDALVLHNEIQRLAEEQKAAAARLARPAPAPEPAPAIRPPEHSGAAMPRRVTAPSVPEPEKLDILAEADMVQKLKESSGKAIVFSGKVKQLEPDHARGKFLMILEGGTKLRIDVPAHAELFRKTAGVGLKIKRESNFYSSSGSPSLPSNGTVVLLPGTHVMVRSTISKGVVLHSAPASFLENRIIGSDNAHIRSLFRADCLGPCTTTGDYATQYCTTCGHLRDSTRMRFYYYD